jgi:hypothetical protein
MLLFAFVQVLQLLFQIFNVLIFFDRLSTELSHHYWFEMGEFLPGPVSVRVDAILHVKWSAVMGPDMPCRLRRQNYLPVEICTVRVVLRALSLVENKLVFGFFVSEHAI